VVIPDCGHLPQVEKPDRAAAEIASFVEGVAS
jgi:pimeloyl-ACP methyl ester carboxylesterase